MLLRKRCPAKILSRGVPGNGTVLPCIRSIWLRSMTDCSRGLTPDKRSDSALS